MTSSWARAIAAVGVCVVAFGLTGFPSRAWAQQPVARDASGDHVISVLGGRTRFSAPVNTVEALQKMATANRSDLEAVLKDAGLASISTEVLYALTTGAVAETSVDPGERLAWMTLRHEGKAEVIRNVRWEGKTAFTAYRFSVKTATTLYRFVVPKACGNLSLLQSEVVDPSPVPPPVPTPAPPPSRPAPPAETAPPSGPPPSASAASVSHSGPFIQGTFGQQQRTLEIDPDDSQFPAFGPIGSFSDLLLGAKFGAQIAPHRHLLLAPAVGVAFNLDEGSRTSLFADFGVSYLFDNGGYVGSGFGIWDFNHSENVTPNLLFNVGVPLMPVMPERGTLAFAFEARFFLDEFGDVEDNYQFWAGLRYVFR